MKNYPLHELPNNPGSKRPLVKMFINEGLLPIENVKHLQGTSNFKSQNWDYYHKDILIEKDEKQ